MRLNDPLPLPDPTWIGDDGIDEGGDEGGDDELGPEQARNYDEVMAALRAAQGQRRQRVAAAA